MGGEKGCASADLVSLGDLLLGPLYDLCLWENNESKTYCGEGTVIWVLSGEEEKGDTVTNLMFNCRSEVKQRH